VILAEHLESQHLQCYNGVDSKTVMKCLLQLPVGKHHVNVGSK
jgi:hypothetical protein